MIDLKQFRAANKITRSEMADYLGVSLAFISHVENGRNKLPEQKADLLINNNRGWVVPDAAVVTDPQAVYNRTIYDWPVVVSELSARLDAQNTQIDRLLTIVEQLTAQKK